MTSIPDHRTRWSAMAGGLGLLIVAVAAALGSSHQWSWPLFVWGILIGPLWLVCAWTLTDLLAAAAVKPSGVPAPQRASIRRDRWRRWRVGYAAFCLCAIGIATISAGLHTIWPDLLFTTAFLTLGLLLPLATYPRVKRRLASRRDTTNQ
jgi:hypothetical protein